MKRQMRIISLVLTCLGLLFGPAIRAGMPAHAQGQARLFRAVLTGQTSVKPCGAGILCLTADDAGHSSLLGTVQSVTNARVTLSQVPCDAGQGPGIVTTDSETTTLTSKTGDSLQLVAAQAACHGASGTIVVGGFMIVGGSGQFAGARGSGRVRIVESATGAETVHLVGMVYASTT